MSLEPGGYADKVGNRYEGRWIVRQLLRVLNETLKSVVVEAIGDDQDGVDLCVELPTGVQNAQQCKIRNLSKDKWTIADLDRRGILASMRSFLDKDATNEFSFVTTLPSTDLHDLCKSARASVDNPETFYTHQVEKIGNERRRAFADFCARLGLDSTKSSDRATVVSYLRRFFIELWPDSRTSADDLSHEAATLVNGDSTAVVSLLADFAQEHLRKTLDVTEIWQHLESHKLYPRRLENDPRIVPAVADLKARFKESIGLDLIDGELIHRDETDRLLANLKEHAVVILHGQPGQGKSGILYELVQKLKDDGVTYVPIRLDRNEPKHTPQQFGSDLGLPESPVHCLKALCVGRQGVLILDQLDAIRWTSRHSLNALEVCKSLVREIRSLRDLGCSISVVLACRTYDLQNDPQIKNWFSAEKAKQDKAVEIAVSSLTVDQVRDVAQRVEPRSEKLTDRQTQILQLPQHLTMWVRIVRQRGAFEFQNRIQLMREFWTNRMGELARRNVSGDRANSALATLVTYMEKNGAVAAPQSIIDDPALLEALCATGLLARDGAQITFGHQSYLDFQIASRVVREIYDSKTDILGWLGNLNEQSLFRREQLRQALCLQYEESPNTFLESIKRLLSVDSVRFHLKHLCLEVLGQLDRPSDALLGYLDELIQKDKWKEHVLGTVYFRHAPYIKGLIDRGTIATWLETELWRNHSLWLLRGASELIPDEVTELLRLYLGRNNEWNDLILATIPWNVEDDSEKLFKLRLDLARLRVYRDHVDWTNLDGNRSIALASTWTAADLSETQRRGAQQRSRFESWSRDEAAKLTAAVQSEPTKAWDLLARHVARLAPVVDEPYGTLQQWIEGNRFDFRHGMEGVPHALVELLIACGKTLAASDPANFWEKTRELRVHESPVVEYILIGAYAALPADYATTAIEWLLADLNRLCIGTGENEPEWRPAARMIQHLSPNCSEEVFRKLEQTLIHYHSPDELRDAEYWLTTWKNGYFGDYWGRAQHFLLPALDSKRRSTETIGLIGVLDRKFESYASKRFLKRSHARGGTVGSTLGASPERISDQAWLGIVTSKAIPLDGGPTRHWNDDHITESSVRMFSSSLAHVAKRFPRRFGHLALQFPDDIASEYRAAIIDGLTNTNSKAVPGNEQMTWEPAPVSLIEQVLARFPSDSSQSFAVTFCWLMYHRAAETWSNDALKRLVDYACNHPNPETNSIVIGNDKGFDAADSSVSNLESNSLNSVRSVAGLAIGEHLRNHPDLFERFRPALEHLCNDPHPAVRVAGIEACLTLLNSEKDFAINCFCQASSDDLRVAASRWAVHYFNVGMESHFDQLATIIFAMLNSDQDEVAREGASELVARWVFHDYFDDTIENYLTGTVPQRMGIAHVVAGLVHKPEYFNKCSGIIERLKNDREKEVRSALRGVMNSAEVLSHPKGIEFVRNVVSSLAFKDEPSTLIYTLREYTGSIKPFADLLFEICRQFVGPLAETTRDPAHGTMHDLSEILPMLMRLYEEATEEQDSAVLNECLNTFDLIFQHRLGSVSDIARIID